MIKRRAMNWTAGVRFSEKERDFSLPRIVQTVYGDYLASYAIGGGDFYFLGSKEAEA